MSVTTIIFVVLSVIDAFLGMATSLAPVEDNSAVERVFQIFLLGIVGQQLGKSRLGQVKEPLVMPKRVVGIEADSR